jgi:hypothetical protein
MTTHDPLTIARFWSKVEVVSEKHCWLWRAGGGSHGYGTFYPRHGVQKLAHRFALELFDGPSPEGHEALHSCDTKRCVNPRHLRWGTHAENMSDAAQRGLMFAPRAKQSECPHGHRMTPANTIHRIKRSNDREYETSSCRECNRIYLAKRRENRRSA